MTRHSYLFGALLLTTASVAHACPGGAIAPCDAHAALADARDYQENPYLESDEGGARGPLSVHVTTFDGSPSTPGMWYERPRSQAEEEALIRQHEMPAAPFDRPLFDNRDR